MRLFLRFAAVFFGLVLSGVACAPAFRDRPAGRNLNKPKPELWDVVRALEGKSDPQRRDALGQILQSRNVPFRMERYAAASGEGVNFLFELGTGRKELVLSAHYDAKTGSPGANDDASCISSILGAYERLKGESLENLKVRFVFFDDEESGMEGSDFYVRTRSLGNVIAMYSLELCGIGDAVAVWDLKKEERERPGIRTLIQTLREMPVHHVVEGKIPGHSSDHKKFAAAGIPAVAVTIYPKREEALLKEFMFQPRLPKWADRKNRPSVFQTYHTADDTAATLQESALQLMSEAIYRTVMNLNRGLQSSSTTVSSTPHQFPVEDRPGGRSTLGGPPSRTTLAIARPRVCEMLRCARRTPRASASSLAAPENSSVGGPFSVRTTSTSIHRTPRAQPAPRALRAASFAAKRAA